MLEETGCDAVMIGRGVLGNPWLIKECVDFLEKNIEPKEVSSFEKLNMLKRHYELLVQDKSDKLALLEIRSHAIWYLKGMIGGAKVKTQICSAKTSDDIFKIIGEYLESYEKY